MRRACDVAHLLHGCQSRCLHRTRCTVIAARCMSSLVHALHHSFVLRIVTAPPALCRVKRLEQAIVAQNSVDGTTPHIGGSFGVGDGDVAARDADAATDARARIYTVRSYLQATASASELCLLASFAFFN